MLSQNFSIKKILIGLLVLLILTVLAVFLYYLILHPLVSHYLLVPKNVHIGIHYWDSSAYIQYESGEEFQNFVSSTKNTVPGQIIDFYHIDHHLRDNPIYGKMCDIFAVDIQMDEMQYAELIGRNDLAYCGPIDSNYKLYMLSNYEPENELYHGFIATYDDAYTVRLILLTDTEPEPFLDGYCSIIFRQSFNLSWG